MPEGYIEILQGVVALPCLMDDNLANFAHRIKVTIEEEQLKPLPDNALIALLCDAARVGYELVATKKEIDL